MGLLNTFFRPAIFEARNAPMFVAGLETSLIALAMLSVLGAWRATIGTLVRSPFLVSGTVFVFVFGVGVGLATRNLGSLSRYRMPMMPFYATTLLILHRRGREVRTAALEAEQRARLTARVPRSRPA